MIYNPCHRGWYYFNNGTTLPQFLYYTNFYRHIPSITTIIHIQAFHIKNQILIPKIIQHFILYHSAELTDQSMQNTIKLKIQSKNRIFFLYDNIIWIANNIIYPLFYLLFYLSLYIGNKFNSSKILHVIVWKSNYWKFYDFNWGTNKKQNC